MKKVWTATFVACALAVGLAAQEPSSKPPAPGGGAQAEPASPARPATPPQQPSQSQASARTVTISGCIQSAPAASATAGAAGAQATATAGSKFVLANAKPAASASAAAGAGAGGAVGTAGTATRYSLEGDEKTISPHLNHQVEITGMVQSSSASPTGAERAAAGSTAAGPTLKVESVKMVAATCSN